MKFYPDHMFLAAGWIVYFFLHSWLAANHVKKKALNILSINRQSYRLIYNLISLSGLFGLLFFNLWIPSQTFMQITPAVRWGGAILFGTGILIIISAFKIYPISEFLGIQVEKSSPLKKDGILNIIRHPLYLGIILMAIGFLMYLPLYSSMISSILIFVYLPVGIWLEERKLMDEFGSDYINYKSKVPSIIPRIKIR